MQQGTLPNHQRKAGEASGASRLIIASIALCSFAATDDTIRIEPIDEYPWARVSINWVHQPGMGGGADPGAYGVAGAWIEMGSNGAWFYEPSTVGCVVAGSIPTFTQFRGRRACIEFDPLGCTVIVTEAGCGLDSGRMYDFLGAWFGGNVQAADFNHDGAATVQDVFDYLSEVFR